MGSFTFTVDGTPAPQGSKIRTRWGMREASKNLPAWRAAVVKAAQVAADGEGLFGPLVAPYRADMAFFIRRPRSTRALFPVAPTVGDLDKLARAVGDALTVAGVIEDDRFIVRLSASKVWAGSGEEPGVVVTVTEVE